MLTRYHFCPFSVEQGGGISISIETMDYHVESKEIHNAMCKILEGLRLSDFMKRMEASPKFQGDMTRQRYEYVSGHPESTDIVSKIKE